MIVEKETVKEQKLRELKSNLKKLGYPEQIIENGIEKAAKIPQTDLRISKEKTDEKVLAFISTNNPRNPNIFNKITSAMEQIRNCPKMNKQLENKNLIHSKKQPPNLEKILCNSKYTSGNNFGVKKCGKNCVCCKYLLEIKEHIFKRHYWLNRLTFKSIQLFLTFGSQRV